MKTNLLLIDDDKLFLLLNKKQVVNAGLHTHPETFLNAASALDWLNQNDQKDSNILILLDLNMPEINGWQFLDKVQETSYQSTIWVALVTSSSDLEDKERSLHYKQVVAYLEKPVKQGELLKLKSIPALQSFF
jgi:CheY-like chemotaxis protein